jgi:hypothetical protein
MSNVRARWVLAFDASCGSCRTVSHAIGQACDGKLEVLPLAHPEVQRWRQATLGPDARGHRLPPVNWVRLRLQVCL